MGVKNLFQNQRVQLLLRALDNYCASRGKQAWVADFCHCSPSTVCDWLHGRKLPTGEQALALQALLDDGNSTQFWRPKKLRNHLTPSRDVRKVAAMLQRDYFGQNNWFMPSDKNQFITELIHWLQTQRIPSPPPDIPQLSHPSKF